MPPVSKVRWFVHASVASGLTLGLFAHALAGQASDLRDRIVANHFEFIPSGDGPFPTLIAIPGCSGIAFQDPVAEATNPDIRDDDRLFRNHYPRTAERLRAEGFAVLLVHVHSAEGLVTACDGQIQTERIAEYITEAVAWAAALDFVDSAKIHVIGWSMGGRGVLTWLNTPQSRTTPVRSVIGVYAGCSDQERVTTHVPLLLLLGSADDIADSRTCEALVDQSPTGSQITVHVYPGARHGFDVPEAPAILDIGSGMTIGYQQAAAEAAWLEIVTFLN
jgi:dienelactone hydrolase